MNRVYWPNFGLAIYNPALIQVAFLQDQTQGSINSSVVLWDLLKRQEVWRITHPDAWRTSPAWSPDGSFLAVAGQPRQDETVLSGFHYEIFLVQPNGVAHQATDLEAHLGHALIWGLEWSPDGRWIAFWLEDKLPQRLDDPPLGTNKHLAVLDTSAMITTDYCIPGTSDANSPLIWSPTSTQIAVSSASTPEENGRVVILDIIERAAFRLPEGVGQPVGWINTR